MRRAWLRTFLVNLVLRRDGRIRRQRDTNRRKHSQPPCNYRAGYQLTFGMRSTNRSPSLFQREPKNILERGQLAFVVCEGCNKEPLTMTYQDPNMPRRPMTPEDLNVRRAAQAETSYMSWILGGVAALAVILGLFFMFGRNDGTTSTAINTDRPAATQPASPPANPPSTTGTGATTPAPANR